MRRYKRSSGDFKNTHPCNTHIFWLHQSLALIKEHSSEDYKKRMMAIHDEAQHQVDRTKKGGSFNFQLRAKNE